MHKNALLIVHDLYQEDNEFPLGTAYIASSLENEGYSVEIYCMDVYHYTNKNLERKLRFHKYDIIGVSFLAARYKETVIDLCKSINKFKKNALFILGGHGPSPIPEFVLRETEADIVVIGEAEDTIVELMKFAHGKIANLHEIQGIAFLEDDKFIQTPRRKPISNLDSIPFPAWHLFPIDKYTRFKFKGMGENDKALSIITSRGCVNACTFCYRMEKGIRFRSMKNVVDEIKYLRDTYGITTFRMDDELFLVSKKRLLEFEDELNKRSLKIKYICDARADIFDKEMALILKRTGCIFLNIGFESSNQRVLDEIQKNVTIRENLNTLDIGYQVGIPMGLNFIWGYPSDNKDTLMGNINLIKTHNTYSQIRTIRPVTPYPGSKLYYEAIEKKLISGPKEFFERFKNSDLITINFTKYRDVDCYKWLLEANTELILDHFKHTNNDKVAAKQLISQFRDLYSGKITTFRGARHYDPKGVCNPANQ